MALELRALSWCYWQLTVSRITCAAVLGVRLWLTRNMPLLSRVLQVTAPSRPIYHHRPAPLQWAFGLLAKRHGPDFPLRTDVLVSKGGAASLGISTAMAAARSCNAAEPIRPLSIAGLDGICRGAPGIILRCAGGWVEGCTPYVECMKGAAGGGS